MIQVHPQLEEGVTGHGVLPNQQMFKTKRRAIYTRVPAMQEVFGPMRQNDLKKFPRSVGGESPEVTTRKRDAPRHRREGGSIVTGRASHAVLRFLAAAMLLTAPPARPSLAAEML